MHQRVISIGDDFVIENNRGERVFKVDGMGFSRLAFVVTLLAAWLGPIGIGPALASASARRRAAPAC